MKPGLLIGGILLGVTILILGATVMMKKGNPK